MSFFNFLRKNRSNEFTIAGWKLVGSWLEAGWKLVGSWLEAGLKLVGSPRDMLDFVRPIFKSRVLKLIYFQQLMGKTFKASATENVKA